LSHPSLKTEQCILNLKQTREAHAFAEIWYTGALLVTFKMVDGTQLANG